jgi:polar amino acid transport system substrate-binding protein
VTGQSPEIARAVLGRLGVTDIRWVLLDFGQAIDALMAGRIDMLANGLFVTPERAARIAFSLPYSRSMPGLLVRRGNPKDLHGYKDVADRADVIVAVLDGSVEQDAMRRLGLSAKRLFVVPTPGDGLTAVRQGRADALALTTPTVSWLAGEAPAEVAVAVPRREEVQETVVGLSAFGFRREDRRLREDVDRVLRGYVGSPEHLALVAPFGFDRHSLPQWSRSP